VGLCLGEMMIKLKMLIDAEFEGLKMDIMKKLYAYQIFDSKVGVSFAEEGQGSGGF
jgi:hypothetical protein